MGGTTSGTIAGRLIRLTFLLRFHLSLFVISWTPFHSLKVRHGHIVYNDDILSRYGSYNSKHPVLIDMNVHYDLEYFQAKNSLCGMVIW